MFNKIAQSKLSLLIVCIILIFLPYYIESRRELKAQVIYPFDREAVVMRFVEKARSIIKVRDKETSLESKVSLLAESRTADMLTIANIKAQKALEYQVHRDSILLSLLLEIASKK